MNPNLENKIKESLSSVLPITILVLILSLTFAPLPMGIFALFVSGAILLIIGMGLFSLGVDTAMLPMGEAIGVFMTKSRKIGLMLFICLIIGIIITIAEPDLQVLAQQVPSVPNMTIIITVAAGVGIFLVIAMLRILFRVPLRFMLVGFYIIVFIVAAFVPKDFVPVAYDSGGVTTGPITVPFILALGVGMSSIRSDKESHNDSFGLVALCSIGPILSVLTLGLLFKPTESGYEVISAVDVNTTADLALSYLRALPHYLSEVFIAFAPIAAVFVIFNVITRRFKKHSLWKTAVGFVYTFLGLVLFLTGVNVGFMPAGHYMGQILGMLELRIILVPLGMLIGYFIIFAEPAVHVLNKQVEEITSGAITQASMRRSLSIGVSISAGIAMIRVVTGLPIFWILVPGYALALVMSFFTPRIFTGIAFDSGGVASGPMTATFLLPFAMGVCESVGGNLMTDAFGAVAMVAMTPLITIQIQGIFYKRHMDALKEERRVADSIPNVIIDYCEEAG